jgi:hypothetical protein
MKATKRQSTLQDQTASHTPLLGVVDVLQAALWSKLSPEEVAKARAAMAATAALFANWDDPARSEREEEERAALRLAREVAIEALIDFFRTVPDTLLQGFVERKKPGYTDDEREDRQSGAVPPPVIMLNEEHDLNVLAANLGLSFEEAAAKLTEAAKSANDPLRRARRVVTSFDRRRAKNRSLREPPEVKTARSFVNRANYQNRTGKKPAP